MAKLTIVYWRDIPAQVIVKSGRKSAKRELETRFIEAIDMCAMKTGMADTDSYLEEWRRAEPVEVGDDLEAEAEQAKSNLEQIYDKAKLIRMVNQGGKENDQ